MPGLYSQMIPFHFNVAGALTVATTAKRIVVPFDFEIEGVSASVTTAPTGANLIVDLLYGPNGTAAGSLTSVFSVDTTKRPTIVAGSFDNQTTTGPNQPTVTGDTAAEPSHTTYLARPTAPSSTSFSGNQPANNTQPASVQPAGQPASANQPQEAPNVRWSGNAGSVLQLAVTQVGTTVAGSDLTAVVWVVEK